MNDKGNRQTDAGESQSERLERVRKALTDGTYRPDPEAIADAMKRSVNGKS